MTERLLIRLHVDGRLEWLALDAQNRALSAANAGAPPAPALERAQRVVVLVPSEDVLLLQASGLPGTRAQALKALPFALEDRLAGSVEDLHFAAPDTRNGRLDGERIDVAVVARASLRGWLEHLAQQGVRADALYSECQVLPDASIVLDGERALWRDGADSAGACPASELPAWIGVLDAAAANPVSRTTHDLRDDHGDALAFFATQLRTEPAVNLLQGEFAPAHRQAPARRLWRTAAALAAAALLLLFVYYGADCWRLSRQSAQLDAQSRAILHEAFPGMDKVAGDPRQLMDSAMRGLAGGGGDSGLMRLLAKIAPILSSTTRTTLAGMEYHNATLELALRAPDVQTLDLMRERLAGLPGLRVEVTAANSGADGVDGRLRIAGATP
ncbi:MAG: type II secretion system protein GspL [Proteobacteria bacterium]|nr:type II secretion system protein GspL [Pseudomonadota bacterium]